MTRPTALALLLAAAAATGCSGDADAEHEHAAAAGETAACCEIPGPAEARLAASEHAGAAPAEAHADVEADADGLADDTDTDELDRVAGLFGAGEPPLGEDGTGLPDHGLLPEFELVADDGESFTRADLLGDVWVVDFIFTRCAGPCPAMSREYQKLQDEDLPARFLSVTVDPSYDGPQVLRQYRETYGGEADEWRLLTGSSESIQALAEGGFRLPVNAGDEPVAGMPPLFHSGKFALVDGRGHVRGYYRYDDALELRRLREDIATLAERS